LLSSAILYVAIVAIWACVLIPRWLRRDSSASASAAEEQGEAVADPGSQEEPAPVVAPVAAPVAGSARAGSTGAGSTGAGSTRAGLAPAGSAPAARRREEAPRERRSAVGSADADPVEAVEAVDPVGRRVRSARRRLLMMLIGLSVASGVLAGAKMAAWWVIVPPSVMLFGYLVLLREAAKADAERREMAQHQVARAARAAAVARRSAPVAHVAPVARVFSMPAAPEPAEEEIYDQYADAKLRAVGD
jgi:hypothetical protein